MDETADSEPLFDIDSGVVEVLSPGSRSSLHEPIDNESRPESVVWGFSGNCVLVFAALYASSFFSCPEPRL